MQKIGRYEVQSEVGRGGMGIVYKAYDPFLDEMVAIKTMSAEYGSDPEFRKKFFEEGKKTRKLNHDNIIQILNLDEDDGRPYLAMEFLEGHDLAKEIATGKLTPLEQKLRIMKEVCAGLSYAHQKGIIHRDIKPGNIFITASGQVKVLDFGLARAVTAGSMSTKLMGTPSYMPPEQWNKQVDERTDIFATGAVFYELLTLKKAFDGDQWGQVYFQIVHGEPDPPEKINPAIPPDLSAIVKRALAKDPAHRYQNMQQFLQALEEFETSLEKRKLDLVLEAMGAIGQLEQLVSDNEGLLFEDATGFKNIRQIAFPGAQEGDKNTGSESATIQRPPPDYFILLDVCHRARREYELLSGLLEKRKQAVPLLDRVAAFEKSGNLEKAVELLDGLLKDDAGNVRAASLHKELLARIEQKRLDEQRGLRVAELVRQAASRLSTDDLSGCQALLDEVSRLQPGYEAAKELQERLQRKLKDRANVAERLETAKASLASARIALDSGNFEQGRELIDRARALGSDAPETAGLSDEIEQAERDLRGRRNREQNVNRLVEEIQALDKAGEEDLAITRVNELLRLEPSNAFGLERKQAIAARRQDREQADQLFQQATSKFLSNDLPGCLEVLDAVLRLHPGHRAALTLLQGARQKMWEEAVLKEKRRHVDEILAAARKALASENFAESRRDIEQARELDPESPRIPLLLQEIDRAEEALRTQTERAARVLRLFEEAHALSSAGKEDDALARLDELLALEPGHSDALNVRREIEGRRQSRERAEELYQKADVRFSSNDLRGCLALLEEVFSIQPDHPAAARLKEAVLREIKEREEREERRRRASESLSRAREAIASEDPARARKELEEARAAYPESPRIPQVLGEIQHTEEIIQARIERDRQLSKLMNEARSLGEAGDFDAAAPRIDAVLELAPGHTLALELKMNLDRRRQRRDRAEELYQRACQRFSSEDLPGCLALLEEVLNLEPHHSDAKELRRGVLGKIKEQEELETRRQLADEALTRARSALLSEHLDQARKQVETAFALYPEYSRIPEVFTEIEHAEKLIQAHTEQERMVGGLLEEAQRLEKAGEEEKALSTIEELLKLEPGQIAARELKVDLENRRQARERAEALYQRAAARFSSGDLSACLALLEEVFSLHAGHPGATALREAVQQNIREKAKLDEKHRAGDQALAGARKALAAGDFVTARNELERARTLTPQAPRIAEIDQAIDTEERDLRERKERERQVGILFDEARALSAAGEEDLALDRIKDVLAVDHAHVEALKLRREIEGRRQARERAGKERQDRIAATLRRATEAEKSGNLERAGDLARSVLVEDGTNAAALEMLERVEAELGKRKAVEERKRDRVARLTEHARRAIRARRFAEAIQALDEILRLEPDLPEVLDMKTTAVAEFEAAKQREARQVEGQREKISGLELLRGRKFPESLAALQRARELLGDDPEVRPAIAEAEDAIKAEERRAQIQSDIAEASKLLASEEFDSARVTVLRVLGMAPEHALARELLERINLAQEDKRKGERIASLLAQSQLAISRQDYEEAGARVRELLLLDARNADAKDLLQAVQQGLEEKSRRERIASLLAQSQPALSRQEFERAGSLAREALLLDPQNEEARNLRVKIDQAQEEAIRRAKVDPLLLQSEEAFMREEFEEAALRAREVFLIDPQNPEATRLLDRIDKDRDEKRERAEILQLLTQCSQARSRQDFDGAALVAREILRRDPGNKQAESLLVDIERQIQARQKEREREEQRQARERNAAARRKQLKMALRSAGAVLALALVVWVGLRVRDLILNADYSKKATASFKAGNYEDAQRILGQWLSDYPGNKEARDLQEKVAGTRESWKIFESALKNSNYEEASAAFGEMRVINPADPNLGNYQERMDATFATDYSDEFTTLKRWEAPSTWEVVPARKTLHVRGPDTGLLRGRYWSDFLATFQLKFANLKGAVWLLRARDRNNYYMFQILCRAGQNARFLSYKCVGGKIQEIQSQTVAKDLSKPDDSLAITIEATGGEIKHSLETTIDPEEKPIVIGILRDQTYPEGRFGFGTKDGEEFLIANFQVEARKRTQ